MSKNFRWMFALSSGILLGLSFPPFPFPWLAWIAYVPLIVALRHIWDWRGAGLLALVVHLLAYAIAGYWVLLHPDLTTVLASAVGMLWLAFISSLPWIAFVFTRGRLGATLGFMALFAAVGAVEMAHIRLEFGFPWPALGHTQASFYPFNQLAEFSGAIGISMFVLSLNVLLGTAGFLERKRRVLALLMALGTVIVVAILGATRPVGTANSDTMHVLAVQPATDVGEWSDLESTQRVVELSRLTGEALAMDNRPELIIWPETALPPIEIAPQSLWLSGLQQLRDSLLVWRRPLLTGAIELADATNAKPDEKSYYNSAFLLHPDSLSTTTYRKQRLVPFAEHVPYSQHLKFLDFLSVSAGGVSAYAPGTAEGVFSVAGRRIGVLICFESVLGYLGRRLAARNVEFVVVLTQDGWWGDSDGYQQHLALNRLRAIELRRPVLQVAATGISALIEATGEVRHEIDWMEKRAAVFSIPLGNRRTVFARVGDWPGLVCLFLLAVLILIGITRSRTVNAR